MFSTLATHKLTAQTSTPQSTSPTERGCRGDQIEGTLSIFGGFNTGYPVVTRVQAGSPAAVAGLQVGDTIVAQGGVDLLKARPPKQRFAVGDTIRLVVHRAGQAHDVALVMGRRDTTIKVPDGAPAICRPVLTRG